MFYLSLLLLRLPHHRVVLLRQPRAAEHGRRQHAELRREEQHRRLPVLLRGPVTAAGASRQVAGQDEQE